MPDSRRGGRPFSRATSSRNAWFSARSATIVTCCASTLACKDALSECSRRTSPARRPTTSRNSASEKASSDAASGNDMQPVKHAGTLSATPSPGNLPLLLLLAATSLKLLAHRSGERFGLGPLGAAMVGNAAISAMVLHHRELYADLDDPVALLRGQAGTTGLSRTGRIPAMRTRPSSMAARSLPTRR